MAKKRTAAASQDPYPHHGLAKVTEAAAFLNTTKFTVYRLINSNKLEAVNVGGQKRIKWETLRAFVA